MSSSNALAIYAKVDNPITFANEMGKTFAAMTGVPLDQGPAVAITCLIEGLTPVDYRRRYHTIDGKPTMRADAMLAEFRMNYGGDYKIIERSETKAAVEFSRNGETFTNELSWEKAKASRWPWKDWKAPADKRQLKDNWGTPTDQQTMMWARCVSDGLRAFCPELVAGVYTPEEMQDVIDAESRILSVTDAKPRKTASEILAEQAAGPTQALGEVAQRGDDENVIDAQFEPAAAAVEGTAANETAAATETDHVAGTITDVQRKQIGELFDFLQVSPAKRDEILAKREVKVVRSLSKEDAAEIIERLQTAERAKRAAASDSGN